jgi:hypothetical protein
MRDRYGLLQVRQSQIPACHRLLVSCCGMYFGSLPLPVQDLYGLLQVSLRLCGCEHACCKVKTLQSSNADVLLSHGLPFGCAGVVRVLHLSHSRCDAYQPCLCNACVLCNLCMFFFCRLSVFLQGIFKLSQLTEVSPFSLQSFIPTMSY